MKKELLVVKIGGNVIDDDGALDDFLKNFSRLTQPAILVHGGGKLATELAAQLNIPQQMVEGRRITDAETLKVVTMVYAGFVNKNIVAKLQSHGKNALGFSGADADMIRSEKRQNAGFDYGFVGDVKKVNTAFLQEILNENFCPVIAPVTHDGKGQLLNTNADTIAAEVAAALSYDADVSLCYLFEKRGVLRDAEDGSSVINKIDSADYNALKKDGIVHSGMIPKLDNAFRSLSRGVKKVIIAHAGELNDAVSGQAGTTILP